MAQNKATSSEAPIIDAKIYNQKNKMCIFNKTKCTKKKPRTKKYCIMGKIKA